MKNEVGKSEEKGARENARKARARAGPDAGSVVFGLL